MKLIKLFIVVLTLSIGFGSCNSAKKESDTVTFGMIADVHQDLQKDALSRLKVFIDKANEVKPDFIIQLGDLSHGQQLDSILQIWNLFEGESHHVLGNHDSDHLEKEKVIAKQKMPARYYSYDKGGIHCIVLDLNFILEDGEYKDFKLGNNYRIPSENKNLISPDQLKWLDEDLAKTDKPSLIFTHQGVATKWTENLSPSATQIREVLEKHNRGKEKKVIACFSGDLHIDDYLEINDIHYFQINSASYFWIEEAAVYSNGHMAEYKDPLYAFVTVDLGNRTLDVAGIASEFLSPVPTVDNYSKADLLYPGIKSMKVQF